MDDFFAYKCSIIRIFTFFKWMKTCRKMEETGADGC